MRRSVLLCLGLLFLFVPPCFGANEFPFPAPAFFDKVDEVVRSMDVTDMNGEKLSLTAPSLSMRDKKEFYNVYGDKKRRVHFAAELTPKSNLIKSILITSEFKSGAPEQEIQNLYCHHNFYSIMLIRALSGDEKGTQKAEDTYNQLWRARSENKASKENKENAEETRRIELGTAMVVFRFKTDSHKGISTVTTEISPR